MRVNSPAANPLLQRRGLARNSTVDHRGMALPPTAGRLCQTLCPDSEYLRPAAGADTGCSWPLVLHRDLPGALDLDFLPALHTIGLRHLAPPPSFSCDSPTVVLPAPLAAII